ncbi:MAG: Gfo/Idh/MocA family oxidoreductase [Sedimentisphaerales bacterium]|nr:Gfo/Idh/MocA family oxidoreductase [Sedimentisphaerales bacterium]
MKTLTRRRLLKTTLAGGAAAAFAPYSRVLGANNDLRVAVVGFRSQGSNHIKYFSRIPGVRVVALCDADQNVVDREDKKFKERNEKVDTYVDVRKLLEDKSIDAIITATPNHWHALVTVWACQAGKDVYVEKPVSHNIWEGRKMVEAARKYKRIVQAGTQRRSDEGLAAAFEYIRQGNLGKILRARCYYFSPRGPIGKVDGPQPVPEGVDYNLWTGPAPMAPLMRKKLHYDWHWQWPYGNGDLGNNGIHYIDVCRWALGYTTMAPRTISFGGKFLWDDDRQTPNTQVVYYDYQPAPIIFEMRNLPRKKGDSAMDATYRKTRAPVVIECEGGYYAGGWACDNEGKRIKQFKETGGGGHHANFIQAVRSRKMSDLNADILQGHLSTAACHLGNISYRIGREAPREDIVESIQSNNVLLDAFDRFQEHLLMNVVNVQETPRIMGPWVTIDPETETFVGDFSDQANIHLSRNYREPFVVPEKV